MKTHSAEGRRVICHRSPATPHPVVIGLGAAKVMTVNVHMFDFLKKNSNLPATG